MTQRRKRRRSPLLLIFVGVGLIVISIAIVVVTTKEKPAIPVVDGVVPVPALVNYSAPELVLTNLSGGSVSFSEFRGQVVLVNNWAVWCPPCRAEMPALQAYFKAHDQEDFVLVGINAGDTGEQVADFIKEYQLTFPIWLDPTSQALQAFQNNALPSTYVVDKTGTVRLVWMGAVSLDALEAYVTPLLAE